MGGAGSGRHQTRCVVEDALTLHVGRLVRDGTLGPGNREGTLAWHNTATGAKTASLGFSGAMNQETGEGELHLSYQVTDPWDGTKHTINEWIELEGLPQPFGGFIWYFRCPITDRRCRKLHKHPGGRRFASRQVYRLPYASQSKAPYERAVAQAQKIRKKLGADMGIGAPVYRPSGMHQTTFERHLERLEGYEHVVEACLSHNLFKAHSRLASRSKKRATQ